MTVKLDGTNGLLQNYDFQAPTTGFSYTFTTFNYVVFNPAGTLATGTVTMPASPVDGMTVTITTSQQITSLTVNANTGQSIVGGGAMTLMAEGSVTFIYRSTGTTWYAQASNIPVVDVQTFNSTTTWNKPVGGQTMARIQVWGGGGGGARSASVSQACGGGGGGYNEITVPLSYLAASVTATVGGGGLGATVTGNGAVGGTSSFALATAFMGRSSVDAYGGGGGGNGSVTGGGGGGQFSAGTTTADGTPSFNNLWLGGTGGSPTACTFAARSVVFGGGGGTYGTQPAGTSLYGGAGGANAAGTQPAGGGGSSTAANTNGSNGAAGRIVVTCW